MVQTVTVLPGITLRYFPDSRFKQNLVSVQIIRPMAWTETSYNAMIPAVLLRGTAKHPDLRSITLHLDDLYGADVNSVVRRVGDYQTTGLSCAFPADRFTLNGEGVSAPMASFLRELLREPLLENGVFSRDIVKSEKKNFREAIEAAKNDKRAYSVERFTRIMCGDDPFGIPRLGDVESVERVTAETLFSHYEKILRESRIDVFYVGADPIEQVKDRLGELFSGIPRAYRELPPQTAFTQPPRGYVTEEMDVTQARLCMGFTTPITIGCPDHAAMQVCNTLLGGGMNSKLFANIREKDSLCYDIGSGYFGKKGIVGVFAGIEGEKAQAVREKVLCQLKECADGNITDRELTGAKEALCSNLQGIHDTPGAIENYYSSAALSGLTETPEEYSRNVSRVTKEQVSAAAAGMKLHTEYLLKGVQA